MNLVEIETEKLSAEILTVSLKNSVSLNKFLYFSR